MVTRDSDQIAPTIAELNDLDILSCDIHNAYLTSDFREKVWVVVGPESEYEAVKKMSAIKDIYGLKTSDAAFRKFLEETLDTIGYRPRYSNPVL